MIKKEMTTILGSGLSGIGAIKLAIKKNISVYLSDHSVISDDVKEFLLKNNIKFEENGHNWDKISSSKEIVISPGISSNMVIENIPLFDKKNIISEIEFASRFTNSFLIAVTGSNGKTTTSYLIYHILKSSGFNVGIAGNMGKSFSESITDSQFEYYVLEVSSFQLDDIVKFKPDISIITNISEDHLDRYNYSFSNYISSKFRIIKNQTSDNTLILNGKCKNSINFLKDLKIKSQLIIINKNKINNEKSDMIFLKENKINSTINNNYLMMNINNLSIQGNHNIQNSMAAICVAQLLNISNESIKDSLRSFKNIPHRLEHFLTIQKVKYINDSKATNVNAVYYALESVKTPIIWIIGGVDKGNDYSDLIPFVKNKVKAIICLGMDNSKPIEFFSNHCDLIVSTNNMKDAVKSAYEFAKQNDTVLLSPACASFDLFKNFEDRGDQFKEEVRKL
jgi:UDP-N-acetylmuramoylalanine--D-glutamate ligase